MYARGSFSLFSSFYLFIFLFLSSPLSLSLPPPPLVFSPFSLAYKLNMVPGQPTEIENSLQICKLNAPTCMKSPLHTYPRELNGRTKTHMHRTHTNGMKSSLPKLSPRAHSMETATMRKAPNNFTKRSLFFYSTYGVIMLARKRHQHENVCTSVCVCVYYHAISHKFQEHCHEAIPF